MIESPAIALTDVSKTYANGTVALSGVNLAIARSQFVSLVGPSGCGKSTVLKLISGLSTPSSGQLQWLDPDLKSHLAFVFQDAALMPWATVWDNVKLPLKLAGIPDHQARLAVSHGLQMVDLEGFERAYPRQLSGGMKMRVSIARALVTQPSLLLMDEPFGALDELTRSRLNVDLLHLWEKQQWTVLFVTHNIYEAVYLSQRVVVMASRPGRIVADIAIDAPSPRPAEFRTSSEFMAYCRTVSSALVEAMQ